MTHAETDAARFMETGSKPQRCPAAGRRNTPRRRAHRRAPQLLEAKDAGVRASLPPREAIRPRMPDLGGMPSVARDWPGPVYVSEIAPRPQVMAIVDEDSKG